MSEVSVGWKVNNNNTQNSLPVIKVIGLGGGGSNAVRHMATKGITDVELICANTDQQHLQRAAGMATLLRLGEQGLGAGMNVNAGREATLQKEAEIRKLLEGSDMVFVAAGMGGGTGTGAAPVVAEIAQDLGILTIAVVTKPFDWEDGRAEQAQTGIDELSQIAHSLIVIANQNLLDNNRTKDITMRAAFGMVDDVLFNSVRGISDIATKPGSMNIDFQDIKAVTQIRGRALISTGIAKGKDRIQKVLQETLQSPLLEQTDPRDVGGILFNLTSKDSTITEWEQLGTELRQRALPDTQIKGGWIDEDDDLEPGEIRLTALLTGVNNSEQSVRPKSVSKAQPSPTIGRVNPNIESLIEDE